MKVLQLGKSFPIIGGVEKVMYDLLSGLSKTGIQCDMLCASHSLKSSLITVNKNAKIITAASLFQLCKTFISPCMIWKMRNISFFYDIIHVHHPDPMAALALLFSNYRGKVVLHWHSDILTQKIALKIYAPLQRWLINRADVIVGTTPIYVQNSPFLKNVQNKVVCIPIGVDSSMCDIIDIKYIREKYENKKIIFSLGRLVPYKGFKYLIESAVYLPKDYVILIGGTGELKVELENIIEKLSLENRVFLLGRVSEKDVVAYYNACHLFCLSSIWKTEAFAIVQIEAMSCGKPVVATNIENSGVSWVNKNGDSGLNVSPKDSKELADAITYLLSDKQRYWAFSERALYRYNSYFRKEVMIAESIKLYKSIL